MRPGQQQNKQRMRGRGRKGPNPMSRSYESNGPDVKIRGTAQHVAEKYLTLARDASASGDRVMAENYLQHAEHYGRIVAAAQGSFQVQRDEREVEYDEDGEEIFEGGNETGYAQPETAQPQMRETRENGPRENAPRDTYQRDGQREPGPSGENRQRENRDRGNRDGNRESYNRDNRNDRDQNRDYQARDGQNRDGQNRDGQPQNRDGQNRDNPNRDQPRGNREFNRENREGRGQREFRDNRTENRGENRETQPAVPSGLGPQPFVGLPPSAPSFEAEPQQPQISLDAEPVNVAVPVEATSDMASDAPVRADGEPRRRGRPRRARMGEGESAPVEAGSADVSPAPVSAPAEAPIADAEMPAPTTAAGDAPEGEVKAKRRPGRPRKKKTEDEGSEEGGEHLPAFLMASNG